MIPFTYNSRKSNHFIVNKGRLVFAWGHGLVKRGFIKDNKRTGGGGDGDIHYLNVSMVQDEYT